jgi:hypothetical protein
MPKKMGKRRPMREPLVLFSIQKNLDPWRESADLHMSTKEHAVAKMSEKSWALIQPI